MTLKLEKISETQLRGTRLFSASKERLFEAHFNTALVKKWMLGPPGWTMPECEIAAEVGAPVKFTWANEQGERFGLTGVVEVIDAPHHSVHTELFSFPGATLTRVETFYRDHPQGSELELTITYENAAALEAALKSDMANGMETSYARIDGLPK